MATWAFLSGRFLWWREMDRKITLFVDFHLDVQIAIGADWFEHREQVRDVCLKTIQESPTFRAAKASRISVSCHASSNFS